MTKKAISAAKRAAVIKAYLTLSSFNSSFQILERSSFVCFSASLARSSRYFTWVADAKYCRSDNDVATVPPDESNEIGVSERWSSGLGHVARCSKTNTAPSREDGERVFLFRDESLGESSLAHGSGKAESASFRLLGAW
jgi:hypothetical protein